MSISKAISKVVGDKRRWRAYKARVRQLPDSHRAAVDAIERYLMYFARAGDADSINALFEDLVDLFEQAATDGTPIRMVVGEDPVEFVETFLQNYATGGWVSRERDRLIDAIARAEGEEGKPRS